MPSSACARPGPPPRRSRTGSARVPWTARARQSRAAEHHIGDVKTLATAAGSPTARRVRPEVLIEPIQCALPSFLGGSRVVTGRRVVVEAVIGALVDMSLMWHLRLGQRGVEGRPSLADARVLLAVLRIDRRLDLGRVG